MDGYDQGGRHRARSFGKRSGWLMVVAGVVCGLCGLAAISGPPVVWEGGRFPIGTGGQGPIRVRTVVARAVQRLVSQRRYQATEAAILRVLRPEERRVLAEEAIRFRVNVPVRVFLAFDTREGQPPFWVRERGFQPTGLVWNDGTARRVVWAKDFPAGEVSLGISGWHGVGLHYLILLRSLEPGTPVECYPIRPSFMRGAEFVSGVAPYLDANLLIRAVPPVLAHLTLLQIPNGLRNESRLSNPLRTTPFPYTVRPESVVLTWSNGKASGATVQWFTSEWVRTNWLVLQPLREGSLKPQALPQTGASNLWIQARAEEWPDPGLANDPVVRRHEVGLTNLPPGTVYRYWVGSPYGWTGPMQFHTAPSKEGDLTFVFLGSVEGGLPVFTRLIHLAEQVAPEALFCVSSGNLVTQGNQREQWDALFRAADGYFCRHFLVPAIGNRECQNGHPTWYLDLFALPQNGAPDIEPKRSYSLRIGDLLLVVLDSNLDPITQSTWLEEVLSESKARWKVVVMHHSLFPGRVTQWTWILRREWGPIIDRYQVDLVLSGHDPVYLRTWPIRGGRPVQTFPVVAGSGTIYVTATAGARDGTLQSQPYAAKALKGVPTIQVIRLRDRATRLEYQAYDPRGHIVDQFFLTKSLEGQRGPSALPPIPWMSVLAKTNQASDLQAPTGTASSTNKITLAKTNVESRVTSKVGLPSQTNAPSKKPKNEKPKEEKPVEKDNT